MNCQEDDKFGFTLVEVMIVVMIIWLLASLMIPGFDKSRRQVQKRTCWNNLRQIDGAKTLVAIRDGLGEGDDVDPDDVNALLDGAPPSCPAGGTYDYRPIGRPIKCSTDGHRNSQNF